VVFVSLITAKGLRDTWLAPTGADAGTLLEYLFPAALLAGVFVLLFRYQGLYSRLMARTDEIRLIAKGAGLGVLCALGLGFFYRGYSYSRVSVLIFYPLSVILLTATRGAYQAYRRAVLTHRAAVRRVLIVGAGEAGRHLGETLLQNPSYYELVGHLDDNPAARNREVGNISVLGVTADLERTVVERGVHEVLLALPSASRTRIQELIGECLRLKVRWKLVPDLYDVRLERVHLDLVGGLPLIGLRGSAIVGFNWLIKRTFDVGVAAAALLLAAPLFALIAAATKLSSRGPVLFRQTRVGLRGETFTFLKFRSMRVSNDTGMHEDFTRQWIYGRTGGGEVGPRSVGAAAAAPAAGVHKIVRDPRVTRLGRLLRRTSLDELPQLWNVLRGEMSIVGPRPALPYEVARYTEWHKRRLEVLPGITGLWQVSGRNALSFEEMIRLDIEYVETWSLDLDIRIALRTIPVLLFGRAY